MDRFDESFHSCPIDGSDESNDWTKFTAYSLALLRLIHQSYHLCPMDRFHESFYSCPMDTFDESYHSCPTNLTIGRIFTVYLSLTNALRLIRQSYHSCPMDRFDESFHSSPMDGSDKSNHLCSMDRTRHVLISFSHYCDTKFTNRTDGVDSTVLTINPSHFSTTLGLRGCLNEMRASLFNWAFFNCHENVSRLTRDDFKSSKDKFTANLN